MVIIVRWVELKKTDTVFYIAEKRPGGNWEFFECRFAEVRWYQASPTPALVEKANQQLAVMQSA